MRLTVTRFFPNGLLKVAAAIGVGLLLRTVVNLHPIWWLAWVAQVPMLYLALRANDRDVRWMVALAAVVGTSVNFPYYAQVMPTPLAALITIAQALLWVFVARSTRRIVLRYGAWWTVFAYPVLWVAVDTLLAAALPDGNWGSLAYTQSDFLPLLQVAALFGVAGPLFLLTLGASGAALTLALGKRLSKRWLLATSTMLLLAAGLAYGTVRLHAPSDGATTTVGLVAIDDAIGLQATEFYRSAILQQYDRHIEALSQQGAAMVVLPEKIAHLNPALAQSWQQHFAGLAAAHHIWLEVGVDVDDGHRQLNLAWLFNPSGTLTDSYQKHYLAPPERHVAASSPPYEAGQDFTVREIGTQRVGLAICKDMHFAALGRAYGERQTGLMLVPAWDFDTDGWLEARTTLWRGVENGYSIVRAARAGVLTVSDPAGRVLAEATSRSMPGATLLAKVPAAPVRPTLYTRTGDVLGWACVIAAAVLLLTSRRKAEEMKMGYAS
ncbi:MAG: hypothetical protein JO142_09650 [Burkholderiales bacterium]|nr:hypothetical protein [Burkholderiales bacterium]